jgi:hypothetical protein
VLENAAETEPPALPRRTTITIAFVVLVGSLANYGFLTSRLHAQPYGENVATHSAELPSFDAT